MRNILFLALLALGGCSDANWAQYQALGAPQRVTLYGASGNVVRVWTSTGKVSTEEHSDGWYFQDANTKKLIRVSGTVVIESVQ